MCDINMSAWDAFEFGFFPKSLSNQHVCSHCWGQHITIFSLFSGYCCKVKSLSISLKYVCSEHAPHFSKSDPHPAYVQPPPPFIIEKPPKCGIDLKQPISGQMIWMSGDLINSWWEGIRKMLVCILIRYRPLILSTLVWNWPVFWTPDCLIWLSLDVDAESCSRFRSWFLSRF